MVTPTRRAASTLFHVRDPADTGWSLTTIGCTASNQALTCCAHSGSPFKLMFNASLKSIRHRDEYPF